MITRSAYRQSQLRAFSMLQAAGIAIKEEAWEDISVADFGLSELESTGAQILTLADLPEFAVKLIMMFPMQTLPQHRHPPMGDYAGKVEVLRCEWGEICLCVEGEGTASPKASPPAHRQHTYTAWREIVLHPGDQVMLAPNTWHWFQGGPEGGVLWSYSSRATDVKDEFTDPMIVRTTVVVDGS